MHETFEFPYVLQWNSLRRYFSYFSVDCDKKHHDQGNLQKKTFNWDCGFVGLESMMTEQRHGGRHS